MMKFFIVCIFLFLVTLTITIVSPKTFDISRYFSPPPTETPISPEEPIHTVSHTPPPSQTDAQLSDEAVNEPPVLLSCDSGTLEGILRATVDDTGTATGWTCTFPGGYYVCNAAGNGVWQTCSFDPAIHPWPAPVSAESLSHADAYAKVITATE